MNKNRIFGKKAKIEELTRDLEIAKKAVEYWRGLMKAYAAAVQAERDWSETVRKRISENLEEHAKLAESLDQMEAYRAYKDAAAVAEEAFQMHCPGRVYETTTTGGNDDGRG